MEVRSLRAPIEVLYNPRSVKVYSRKVDRFRGTVQ